MKPENMLQISLAALFLLTSFIEITADRPCAARQIVNQSIVCVCNATYCDDLIREVPCSGQYVTYTSSEAGSRFKKGRGYFSSGGSPGRARGEYTINLDPSTRYQKIIGFGGAVTDSAAMVWKTLPVAAQQKLIDSYYGKNGLEYNMARVPIGCSDFSVRRYTYDDIPGDVNLESFRLQKEDNDFKIPMLEQILKVATSPVNVVSSYWTPPDWMKYTTSTNRYCGFLKRQHYQLFANYLLKFIDSYKKAGIDIWAITTGNEPANAHLAEKFISCLGWNHYDQGDWIVNYLGPTIRNSKYSKMKILALDDQRYTIRTVFDDMVSNNSKILDVVDGIAVHYYTDSYISSNVLTHVAEAYPKLFVLTTEACAGFTGWHQGVVEGSWKRAKTYIRDIFEDLNHFEVGWIDWNLCLNLMGGPNVDANYVDAPIIVDDKKQEFIKQPMFYALGHISKFIVRDSIKIKTWTPPCSCSISHVAVLTPRKTIVVVLHNDGDATSVTLKQGKREATINLEAESITTVEYLIE